MIYSKLSNFKNDKKTDVSLSHTIFLIRGGIFYMEQIKRDGLTITWLRGGITHLDGGAMFGVVPKPLWTRLYPCNEKNQIPLRTDPMLIEYKGKKILVESGLGNHKMNEKFKRNFGVLEESFLEEDLATLGYKPSDIDIVLMTHLHFDHACGLTKYEGDTLVPTFENAMIYATEIEWNEMRNPNIRSKNTYWKENWEAVEEQVRTYEKQLEILPGLKMIHTGGHSDGHAIMHLEHNGEHFYHLADIYATTAYANPLWVMAYDDYPMDSIFAKKDIIPQMHQEEAWLLFYHDAFKRAIKFNQEGKIVEEIERIR